MTGPKTILCSTRDSYRIRLSKIILGNRTDPFRQVFELKGGHLKLWWERFWLWEIFRKEILWNEELMIILSIRHSHFAWRKTSRTNGTENLAVLVIAKKVGNTSREATFCALLVLVSEPIVFHIIKSFMPLSSGLPCITGVISRVFHPGGQMHGTCTNGE